MESDVTTLQASLPLCCTTWTLMLVSVTCFLFFVVQCTWFSVVKLELMLDVAWSSLYFETYKLRVLKLDSITVNFISIHCDYTSRLRTALKWSQSGLLYRFQHCLPPIHPTYFSEVGSSQLIHSESNKLTHHLFFLLEEVKVDTIEVPPWWTLPV